MMAPAMPVAASGTQVADMGVGMRRAPRRLHAGARDAAARGAFGRSWLLGVDPATTDPVTGDWDGKWGRNEMLVVGVALLLAVVVWRRIRARSK
jgi:hypothetical protein